MKEIGGFMELEIPYHQNYYPYAIRLNSARNCLRRLVRSLNISKIYIPAYTCPTVWECLADEGCKILFYNLNEDFTPDLQINSSDFFLYTNYFGVCDRQVYALSKIYDNMIVDNSQAFFSSPSIARYSFNSPRKFFGLPDGGLLFGDVSSDIQLQDVSLKRFSHLVERIELGANAAYENFKKSDASLDNEPIKQMSKLTSKLLDAVDYPTVIKKRRENYLYLHRYLCKKNELNVSLLDTEVPMVYPFLIKGKGRTLKQQLIANKIYVATYWSGQKDMGFGRALEEDLVPLPIDQRYGFEDMQRILKVLNI